MTTVRRNLDQPHEVTAYFIAAVVFTFVIALGSLYALIPARDPEPVTLSPTEVAGGTWKTW